MTKELIHKIERGGGILDISPLISAPFFMIYDTGEIIGGTEAASIDRSKLNRGEFIKQHKFKVWPDSQYFAYGYRYTLPCQ